MIRRLVRGARRRLRRQHWRLSSRFGYCPAPLPNGVRVGAVLLSYDRPQNIDPILASLLRGRLVERVVISNNNPSRSSRDFVSTADDRLVVLDQPQREGPGLRWRLANEFLADVDVVVCVDDDVFLYPRQVEQLAKAVVESPDRPHGLVGRIARSTKSRADRPVDTLLRVYAVTREQVRRYVQVLDGMTEHRDLVERFCDDVVISMTGDEKPMIHDFGPIVSCDSSADPRISLYLQDGFGAGRRLVNTEAQAVGSQLPWWNHDTDQR